MWLAVEAGSQPPVTLLYLGQAVTLLVAVVAGWFSLRTKRADVDEQRRARFDARVDKELDEAEARLEALRRERDEAQRVVLRLERLLILNGIDPDTGKRGDGNAGTTQ